MSYYIHPTAVIDEGAVIGNNSQVWHFCHLMPGCSIGESCILGQNVFIATGVTLGRGVKVQNNVSIYTGVTCEDDVFLGPSMVFTNVINPRSAIERKHQFRTTLVKQGASIGANVTIVCGNNIGRYAFVGAGAVVTREVPDHALVMGNPARQAGWVSEHGHKLDFDSNGKAICPGSGAAYLLQDKKVRKL